MKSEKELLRCILEAVRDQKVTTGTRSLSARILEAWDRRDALAAGRACTTAHVAKQAIPSVEHHEAYLDEKAAEAQAISVSTWSAVLERTAVDHRGWSACEACGKTHGRSPLEPHHLELGAGGRRDAPEVVMALCATCHRTGPKSAHRSPRRFALEVVIPWAKAHGFTLPNRKEYRDA